MKKVIIFYLHISIFLHILPPKNLKMQTLPNFKYYFLDYYIPQWRTKMIEIVSRLGNSKNFASNYNSLHTATSSAAGITSNNTLVKRKCVEIL